MESILIIDKEENVRNALSLIFEPDYTVLAADSPQKAEELISIGKPDVILTELLDQKLNYLEQLLKTLGAGRPRVAEVTDFGARGETAFHCDIPIIVLTSISELPLAVEAMKLGICDYITKPYDTKQIKTAVQNALEQRRRLAPPSSDEELIESSVQFHGYLRYVEVVKNFSKLVNATYKQSELVRQITEAISEALDTNRCLLLLYDESADAYIFEPRSATKSDAVIAKDQSVLSCLRQQKRPMFRQEVAEACSEAEGQKVSRLVGSPGSSVCEDEMLEQFSAEGIHLLAPMLAKEELVGVIALGEKYNHAKYNQADIKLLDTIALQSAFALKDALYRQKLSDSNKYLKNLLENIGSALIVVDNQGNVTLFNKEAQNLTGYPAELILTQKTDMLSDEFAAAILETYETGQPKTRFETQLNTKDGAKLPVGLNTALLKGGDEKIGVIVTFAVLTEAKREEEVERLNSRLAVWHNIVPQLAHELRNSLVSIKTCVQLLPERYQDEAFREESCKLVSADVERITTLLDKLQRLAWPISLNRQYHDVNVILSKAISQAKRNLEQTDVEFVVDYNENLPQILVDQDWLVEAFQNIIKNCMAYLEEEKKELKIRTSLKKRTKEQADVLVEILYPRPTAGEQFQGLSIENSIQLALSDKIIREHNGIVYKNNADGDDVIGCEVDLPTQKD